MDITKFYKLTKTRRQLKDLVQLPPEGSTLRAYEETLNSLDLKPYSEFTINPKPEYASGLSPTYIKAKIERDIRHAILTTIVYMNKYLDITTFSMEPKVLMIGEHGKQGLCKLHYHGIIGFLPNDAMCHFVKLIRRKIGRTELQYIRNDDLYKKYIFKSYHTSVENPQPETWGKHSYININIPLNE